MAGTDLHCHTWSSDNTMSEREVVALAASLGIDTLAITDHDTTAGIAAAVEAGAELGVRIIPGIEISAYDFKRGRRAHILGYAVEPGHPALEAVCRPVRERRHEASREMVRRLQERGYPLEWERVCKYAEHGTGVYKQHIMHALLDLGLCVSIHGPLYKELFARGSDGKPDGIAFLRIEYADAVAAIRAIRAAGGAAVLAHPGQLGNFEAVEEWVAEGLGGIEAFHTSHTVEHTERALQLAERYDLAVTGGSDFHGDLYGSPEHPIGCVLAPEDAVERLLAKRAVIHSSLS